ncbi:MAG: polysaccharide ABC transporter ATP-binding protein [Pyrinomonadaceae bacterium]|nr:polysaccharide ABC transporter ATP-binding protein [Pyrinomonadaceae bacterium]MCX7640584.1 polysaccharide ABC transporter ATP-binding protein [Pyrinomonadaceae bacterium]MDW8303835.1 polysaccharide ABC transporter ATP-binding protein [Acidobacteriota bacterium]
MSVVISVEKISKKFDLHGTQSWKTLRDTLTGFFQRSSKREEKVLWALRDVSFNVYEGEILGIVGHNGAGKSTLLKILSRIIKPTSGVARIRGRIGTLLEVGTGFHQELSGRENIFLNGAILGMKRKEIEKKLDEIIAFAEMENFIDEPVKFYSSGMFMRLAFSVAAHLDAEILLLDEVLAVGDVNFQHKCLDKMKEIMNQGRTILFVSHNMSAVTRLCHRAILLEKGRIVAEGDTREVVKTYLGSDWRTRFDREWENYVQAPQSEVVRLKRMRIINKDRQTSGSIAINEPVGVEITYEVLEDGHILIPNFHFFTQDWYQIFAIQDVAGKWRVTPRQKGTYVTTAWLNGNLFNEGRFFVEVAISSHSPNRVHFRTNEPVSFEIFEIPNNFYTRGDYMGHIPGVLRPLAQWETECCQFRMKSSS